MLRGAAAELWDLPNLVSLLRVPLAGALWVVPRQWPWILLVLILAAVSDVADGWLARRLRPGRPTSPSFHNIGGWLDPLCDKLFLVSLLALAYVTLRPPGAVVLLVATRELLQLPLLGLWIAVPALRRRYPLELQARFWGKAATAFQFVAAAVMFLGLRGLWEVAAATAIVGVLAPVDYAGRTLRAPRSSV